MATGGKAVAEETGMKPGVEMSVTRVRRACEEPARRLVSNRGSEGAVIVETVCYHENVNYGFNAMSEKNEDLVTAGVIDPHVITPAAEPLRRRRAPAAGSGSPFMATEPVIE